MIGPISALKRLKAAALRFPADGRVFRLLAPQSPPAQPGSRHQLAICDLIPNLGDKIMVYPLLDALRRENPTLEISYFTSGAGQVIGQHPAVDHLYVMGPPPMDYPLFYPALPVFMIYLWWRRELRKLRFDTVVVLRGGVDPFFSHHLAWLLGGRSRVSYSTLLEPEKPASQFNVSPLFTAEITRIDGAHEVSRGGEVLHLAGLLHQSIDIQRPVDSLIDLAQGDAATSFLIEHGLHDRAYAVISPGASITRRAWPSERFAELALREFVPRGWLPVITGGPELSEVAQEIVERCGGQALDLTGKTSFLQLAGVCGHAKCYVANDSGTAHMAGACGTPTLIVTAFAQSSLRTHHASPWRSHPVGPRVAVVQPKSQLSPCSSECIATEPHCICQIEVDEVQLALKNLLQKSGTMP